VEGCFEIEFDLYQFISVTGDWWIWNHEMISGRYVYERTRIKKGDVTDDGRWKLKGRGIERRKPRCEYSDPRQGKTNKGSKRKGTSRPTSESVQTPNVISSLSPLSSLSFLLVLHHH
jgi:hypothetical protein